MSIWELVLVLKIYLHLLIAAGNSPNAGEADIGVISPYAAQVAQIKSAMEAEKMSFQEPDARTDATGCPEVKTVDGYQGREKEVSWRKELKIQVQSSTLIAGWLYFRASCF
ncbi:upf1 [Symbiodinium necroappetens]|uniref:Upf1 protein n=1 Tax=Symbiodinium necroappetens TaxID=1628268 RepID=A0A812JPH6_9DINO|nr:upf1 [Symbiodinium necroappetens]